MRGYELRDGSANLPGVTTGCDPGSDRSPKPFSGVQLSDGLPRGLGLADGEREEEAKAQLGESPGDHALPRQAVHLAVMSVS
jgi:hypothetical protein